MRMDIQKILKIESLEELKELGKMLEIKYEVQEKLGDRIKIRSRSWEELFLAIQQLKNFLNYEINEITPINQRNLPMKKDSNIEYFKTRTDEIIYALIELKGKQRQEKLNITNFCYNNPKYAKKWRNDIVKLIHPDKTKHPKAEEAMTLLQELYEGMVE